MMICRVCCQEDGVTNDKAIEKVAGHPLHKNRYARFVCEACWEMGRVTPVTCRNFKFLQVSSIDGDPPELRQQIYPSS